MKSNRLNLTPFIVLGYLILSVPVFGMDTDPGTQLNAQLSLAEWNESNCEFPRLLGLSESQLQNNYQVLDQATCAQNHQTLAILLQGPGFTQTYNSKFPYYLTLLKGQMQAWAGSLSGSSLLTPAQIPGTRKKFSAPYYNPTTIENELRKKLGVDDGHPADSNCSWQTQSSMVTDAQKNLKDLNFWQTQLFTQGYDCTVSLFKSVSGLQNKANGYGDAQEQFTAQRLSMKTTPHQAITGKPLSGLHIAIFPQLGYDIPGIPAPLELLSYAQLNKALNALGADVHIISRVSAAAKEDEICQSAKNFEKAIADVRSKGSENPKFLVLTRSMGGMIARELFERRTDLRQSISGVILVGSTPYGSVIGDYKSRGDLFDDTYLQQEALVPAITAFLAATPLDLILDLFGFNPDLHALHTAGEIRKNVQTLSHLEFDPRKPTAAPELPVLNVIQLPDSLGSYFLHSQRSAAVDPTFLLMSMYGPTEGSTPLSHAAWDTSKSSRVFVSEFNHLGFWSIEPDRAIDYWLSAIFTGKKLGVW